MSWHHRRNRLPPAVRARELKRAGRRCEICGRPGRLEVHHPLVLSAGGTHDQPLIVTCRECHLHLHHKPDPARVAWARFLKEEFASCGSP